MPAGAAMALCSVSVVSHSLRLKWKKKINVNLISKLQNHVTKLAPIKGKFVFKIKRSK